jgi:hypothetical protein
MFDIDIHAGEWKKDMKQCVELKTNMILASGRQRINFEKCVQHICLWNDPRLTDYSPHLAVARKLMKHWAQSWLLGVPVSVIHFETDVWL